jgi:hypothetical protein
MGSVVVSAALKRDLSCGKKFYHSRVVLCPRSSFTLPQFHLYFYFRRVSPLPFYFIFHQPLLLLTRSRCFLQFNAGSLSVLPVLLRYLSVRPSSPLFGTEILHSPSQFHCSSLVHCSSLLIAFHFQFFPFLQSTLLCSFLLPALYMVTVPWSSRFSCFVLCFSIYYHILY